MTFPEVTDLDDETLLSLIHATDGALSLRDLHAALLAEQDDRVEAADYAASRSPYDAECQRADDAWSEGGL